ncbi:hypothetical protein [Algoriphagus litoralis]|uniref:hypothetical protein n=1 Tax=Algoriphagus litoralis TaxID=2202829 RepID=UPI000DB9B55C|nr:hypothetical protein [Algoriphagus litoralis]
MAAKDSEKRQWTDPKDYGLPFVEIAPLRAKSIAKPKVTEQAPDPAEKEPISTAASSEVVEAKPDVKQDAPSTQTEKKSELTKSPSLTKKEKKASPAWVWMVVVLAVALVSFIIWQLQTQNGTKLEPSQAGLAEKTPAEEPVSSAKELEESTPSDQNQPAVNQDSIPVVANSNPNISKPAETGTTIANTASGNLIRIESKAERPQYFIIVGSLPNEALAIQEANQYFNRSAELFLISPEEGSRNYRIALSKFGSFRLAAEELERIKSQYTEELWILKY